MKLNQEEIEKLYQFTRQHFVEHYDLQTEIVDHLANSIETIWQKDLKISFDEALQIEFRKFGVFGFEDIVNQRRSALSKRYNKIVWANLKQFFTLPKVVLTFALIGILYQILSRISFSKDLILTLLIATAIMVLTKTYFNRKKQNLQFQKTKKKWLFQDCIANYGFVSFFLSVPFQLIQVVFNDDFLNNYHLFLLGFSVFFVIIALITYVILFEIPSKSEEHLKKTYPEYELSNNL